MTNQKGHGNHFRKDLDRSFWSLWLRVLRSWPSLELPIDKVGGGFQEESKIWIFGFRSCHWVTSSVYHIEENSQESKRKRVPFRSHKTPINTNSLSLLHYRLWSVVDKLRRPFLPPNSSPKHHYSRRHFVSVKEHVEYQGFVKGLSLRSLQNL